MSVRTYIYRFSNSIYLRWKTIKVGALAQILSKYFVHFRVNRAWPKELKNTLLVPNLSFLRSLGWILVTLKYLINVQQTLLFFGKSSYLHGLITSYTFINFRKIFLPTRLLHPTRLLAFSKSILWSSNFGSKSQENRKIPTVLWVWMSYLWLKHKIVQ